MANAERHPPWLVRQRCLTFLLLLALGSSARAERSIEEWLDRMEQAVSSLDYHGVFVYLHGDQLETMQLEHHHRGGVEQERLMSLNGEPREVVRNGGEAPSNSPSFTRGLFSIEPRRLLEIYKFRIGGTERIAGRVARKLWIDPLDRDRYGVLLYLDEEKGLPLKSELLGESGAPISQVMFTQIIFEPPGQRLPDSDASGQGHSHRSKHHTAREHHRGNPYEEGRSGWGFVGLPKGFEPRLHLSRGQGEDGNRVEHFILSDGLATLSVYVESVGDAEQGLRGATTVGAVNAYGKRLEKNFHVTAVGEAPDHTVKRVAEAVRRSKGRSDD